MDRSLWSQNHQHEVDRRALILPPTWISSQGQARATRERGQAVHISGPHRTVAARVVDLLGRATELAVVSTFLLADRAVEEALLAAAGRGVRVYVMLASEARLGQEERAGEFDRRVVAEHKALLLRLAGHVLVRSASFFHAKVLVIDPHSNPQGLLLTANLTREALERNEELAVDLTAQEAREAASLLGWGMWELAEHELIEPGGRFRAVRAQERLSPPAVELLATTPEHSSLVSKVLAIIDGARSRIVVASFGWDEDHRVVRRLAERAREGLDVVILARKRTTSMPALVYLSEAGAKVSGFRWLHAKAIWSDRGEALVMSANLQRFGLDEGFELGVELKAQRATELRERLDSWRAGAPWQLAHAPTLGELSGTVEVWREREFVELRVEPNRVISRGEHTATSADVLRVSLPEPTLPDVLEVPAHTITYTWTVLAPVLHPKAMETFRPVEAREEAPQAYTPPVFRHRERLFVAIRTADELLRAQQLREELGADAIVVREEHSL